MLADVDMNLLVSIVPVILMVIITGYFAFKAKAFEQIQKSQGEEITETNHNVNSKNDVLVSKVDALTETVLQLTGDKATLVEQARDKSGDANAAEKKS